MCRFLMIKSKDTFDTVTHLENFSELCRNSEEFQGDGWGVCYLSGIEWKCFKSLKPIWEEHTRFKKIPKTKMLIVHARSAFQDKGPDPEFTQPFVDDNLVFVFNGEISGVRLKAIGKNGAQKIFSLVKTQLKSSDWNVKDALEQTTSLIEKYSSNIKALNIGISDKDKLVALCKYTERDKYFGLHYFDGDLKIICSKPYKPYNFKNVKNNEIVVL